MNKTLLMAATGVLLVAAAPAFAGTDFTKALTEGDVSADVRARYEHVDTTALSKANAGTVRTRLGYTTGDFYGVTGMLEMENVTSISDNYSDGTPTGTAGTSVVADPETTEVNQAFLQYSLAPHKDVDLTARLGRQAIELADGRFVGDSAWRQNQTTFDAVSVAGTFMDRVNATYAFINKTRNNLGDEAPTGEINGDSHVVDVNGTLFPFLNVGAFAYLLDLDAANAALSSNTYGLRVDGSYALNKDFTLMYAATAAMQDDAGNNPTSYDHNMYAGELGLGWNGFTAGLGWERFEGNATTSFTTPFGDTHAFNGRSDVISTAAVIAGGLEDKYAKVGYTMDCDCQYMPGQLAITGEYHDFEAETGGVEFGREWNVGVSKDIGKHFNVELLYADFNADAASPFVDTKKAIAQVTAKF